jgi:hypothetical protein
MGFFKKIGKKIGKLFPGTGRHAAKRAEKAANEYAEEARQRTAMLEEREKKERRRAQKLSIRGLRSKRAASHFQSNENTSYGSPTIG